MRRCAFLLAGMFVVFVSPAVAIADETLARLGRPAPVSSFDGRVLWSEYDPAASAYYLTQRFNGITARLSVAPRSVPFDVDVGRKLGNQTVATYSRCRREPRRRDPRTGTALAQMPQWSTGRGCDVYMLNLLTNVETRVRGASSDRASEFLPVVWGSRIAFARVYDRRRGRAGERAYLYFRSLRRDGVSRRVPAGARGRERFCSGKPIGCRRLVEPGPTTLDLIGRFLMFGWDSTAADGPTSALHLDKLRAGRIVRRRIARAASGEVQAGALLGPQLDPRGRMVWIRSLFGDSTRSQVERYYVPNGNRDSAPLQPVANQPLVYTVIASAVYSTPHTITPLYLASGLVPTGEPCTPQSPCLVEPGCSDAQPCELRAATGLRFTEPGRR
jgi:hypothetical protein